MKLGYTEFSFAYAFTENLIRSTSADPCAAPFFPNLIQEGQLGFDIMINYPGCPVFFQFKLPELMTRNSAVEISKHRIPGLAAPFFRMRLMNRNLSDQHKLLMCLEDKFPNSVFYASPEMGSVHSFNDAYTSARVHLQSALFSPQSIGPLLDNDSHVVAYRDNHPIAWFLSDPQEIRVLNFKDILGSLRHSMELPNNRTLRAMAETTLEDLKQRAPAQIRATENDIRQRIRNRRETFSVDQSIDGETMDVVEDLLVSREIARVAFGLEFLVAQPISRRA